MRVALVHDSLVQDGGAERVLRAMHRLWPDAPIFVLAHSKGAVEGFSDADIRESFLGKLPFGRKKYQWYLPLLPYATSTHDVRGYDVVISSSSTFAKGVRVDPGALHISYCHTPARFLWIDAEAYISGLKRGLVRKIIIDPLIYRLRKHDTQNTTVHVFLANSKNVRGRIATYYHRESTVLYPPVELAKAHETTARPTSPYFVAGGRLVRYKRFDIAIKTFNRLNIPLFIFGTGPERRRLRRLARPHIQFVGRISDEEKLALLRGAEAYIHPQVEDFGITAVEAMSVGRPVIAYRSGGALETVIEGKTGLFFDSQSWESLLNTVIHFRGDMWNAEVLQGHAEQFSEENFERKLQEFVRWCYQKHATKKLSP